MRVTRKVEATVEVSVCDLCGAEESVGATIDSDIRSEKFDPRSRSLGFGPAMVWYGHPHFSKDVCYKCLEAKRHHVKEFPAAPSEMVRIRFYPIWDCEECEARAYAQVLAGNDELVEKGCRHCQGGLRYGDDGEGLQLPEAPTTERMYYGAVVRGERAILFSKYSGYWIPTLGSTELSCDIYNDRGVILLAEHTAKTRWRTVWQATVDDSHMCSNEPISYLRNTYGDEVAERCLRAPNEPFSMMTEVKLRVPMEILQ